MTGPADAERVERAAIATARRREDSEVIDRPDWAQVRTPGSPHAWLNRVLRARLSADAADARVAEVVADHRARGAELAWSVGPSSVPADLVVRLERHGVAWEHELIGLVADSHACMGGPTRGVTVEPLTPDRAEDYAAACIAGWGSSASEAAAVRAEVLREVRQGDPDTASFIAYRGGLPVGTAQVRFWEGGAHLLGASVVPEHRRRGVYRALLLCRVEEARSRGHRHVTTQAVEGSSAPACLRLGFREACRLQAHALRARPSAGDRGDE